ncbi:hypothetical protein [Clostridium kluyveri]|uniref:Uncharacterized protein n=1 Tax=Clostridium kluyveri TaxID=1534 RepID=A0A1L5FE59_CLOKL|nr:hypothetical protein [Clostridium kluyveri]APM41267.1 hypothetical protein BS101_11935 [Clostridium kluyveri]
MEDTELLEKVKQGLTITGTFNDNTLQGKTIAVKQYMLNAGITQEQIETDLGIATLTVGVTDLWNLTSGDISFSPAFGILMEQLYVVSIPDTQEVT